MPQKIQKDIVLYVGKVPKAALKKVKKGFPKRKLRFAWIHQKSARVTDREKRYEEFFDIIIPTNLNSSHAITQSLLPYKDNLLAITCRDESSIPAFAKITPHVPYLKNPTSESLMWSVDKVNMRRRFNSYDKKITPKYKVVNDATKKTRKAIEEKIGFPLVIKPSGLAQSLLVTICYHQEELERELKKTFRKIRSLHKDYKDHHEDAKVLVEEFIDGDMYSIDGYVNSRGKVYFCPPVEIKTGRTIGFDDFFGYKQICPATLEKKSTSDAEAVTHKGVHALGLRSSTFHAELLKNDKGWKIIEIGPRVGGTRDTMYELSFGINHSANDVAIRIPQTPIIPKKTKGHTAYLKFFASKEGTITSLTGVKKAKELKSFKEMIVNKKAGDKARFAKNGGKSVFNITLFNKDRSKLLADIRRLEKMVEIVTKKK